ncbi:MAG: outer rane adhesin like protein [Conexibacter sp.]|nr:outer rane adhesin like protein [Conexibacter sp.]
MTPSPLTPLRRAALGVLVLLMAFGVAGPASADPVATCSAPHVTAHPGRTAMIYAGCSPSTAVPGSITIDQPAHGTVVALSNLTFRYTAEDGYTGPAGFTVHPTGGDGQAWPAFTVTIDVSATADTPPNCGLVSGRVTTRQDHAVIVPINACIDADGDPMTVAITSQPAHGSVSAVRPTVTGSEVTYTPDAGFTGTDTIGYAATDDHGESSDQATVAVDVRPLGSNSPPDCPPSPIRPDSSSPTVDAMVFDNQNTVWLGCRDPDGDPMTLTFVQPPAHGTVVVGPDPSRPSFTYTRAGGYTGPDELVVDLSDGQGATVRKTMRLLVGDNYPRCGPRLEAAVASRVVAGDPGVTVQQPCADPEGGPLTSMLWTHPEHGAVSFDDAAGTLTYTPDIGYVGDDLVGYEMDDGHYGVNYFSVLIHVGPAAPRPIVRAAGPIAPVVRDPAATRAAALLGKSFVAFDLGLGAAVRGFATGAKTVAAGKPVVVVACAKACTVGVDGRLAVAGERGAARHGSLKLVHRALRAKAGGSAVVRLALTKAQRARVAHARKATVTLALTTRAGGRSRLVRRAFTLRSP